MKPRLIEVRMLVYSNVDLFNLKEGLTWDIDKGWENFKSGYFTKLKKYSSKIISRYYEESK